MDKATPTPSTAPTEKIWECKIGGISDTPTPSWSDGPMRQAVEAAFEKVTGKTPAFLFSGWGASLTEPERAVVENRLPNRAEVERLAAQAAPTADRWHDATLPPEIEQRLAPWLTNGAALHPATVNLVVRFARALSKKLAAAETKYGYSDGWLSPDWMDECRSKLMEHIAKGDPRDVAAYCAFLWHHGASTAVAQPSQAPVVQAVQATQAVRMLTREELNDVALSDQVGWEPGEYIEAVQRKFCAVNAGRAIPPDGKIGGV